ncbi:MAG: sulfurtransferase complex subunit TusB [Candidatus Thiothrix putei]|uniref:tRNA 2-thiouridine synthesizing protein B n=2 Tax=Thiothrix TaxID=1030 RepID=A0A1H4EV33_9GAMM|nr:sulfurtransferase complex subunit TusB [Thiothrix caldifontis]WGZ93461.1 MAG: sulfurtransferase complex subunit TusB [Candidatus Thiothrix putei]SEA88865.1 tRNA 2-thiouridine synthesizing protein B [Thiothrix caldifontis]
MSMLHIVNKSPFERVAFESCLAHAKAGDSILMIEDAVVGAVDGSSFSGKVKAAMSDKTVYVLGADLAARGLEGKVMDGIVSVDYAGFVDLTANNDTTQSWL